MGMLRFFAYALLWHGEPTLGWRAFVLFMVGVFLVVWLFDEMARRAIKTIQRRRRSSFVSRLMRRTPQVVVELRKFLSRLRR
jgi:hypothetical protein